MELLPTDVAPFRGAQARPGASNPLLRAKTDSSLLQRADRRGSADDSDRAERRRAAQEMVIADKKSERDVREQAAAQKAQARKAAEEAAKAAKAAAVKAAEDRAAEEAVAAELAAAQAAEAERREAERLAAEAAEAERLAAEAAAAEAAAAAQAEAEAAEAEEAEMQKMPAWVRRLSAAQLCANQHSDPARSAESDTSPAGPILFAADSTRAGPVRVQLADWAVGNPAAPKAMAKSVLVLRKSAALDSTVMGKLPIGSEAFVLETRELSGSMVRALVTATASTATPLGWVTASRDGKELLGGWEQAAASANAPCGLDVAGFYTSLPSHMQATVAPAGTVGRVQRKSPARLSRWWRHLRGRTEPEFVAT
jgi:hypothetical protein